MAFQGISSPAFGARRTGRISRNGRSFTTPYVISTVWASPVMSVFSSGPGPFACWACTAGRMCCVTIASSKIGGRRRFTFEGLLLDGMPFTSFLTSVWAVGGLSTGLQGSLRSHDIITMGVARGVLCITGFCSRPTSQMGRFAL